MRAVFSFAVVMMSLVGLCTTANSAQAFRGAGATFPAPVYQAWAATYEHVNGVKISYDPVGSGAGLEQIQQGRVDFGGSDAPLTAEQLAQSRLVQFPVIIGGVVPVINQMMGIKAGALKLTGSVLADIYLGRIRKWNDPAIAALNPAMGLPSSNITVVHRSDPSGSSLLWTRFLTHESPDWRLRVGASLSPKWPSGVGGTGNEGVAAYVQRTRYSLGYVEYTFARSHNLSDVVLRNQSGQFVQAGRRGFQAALDSVGWSVGKGSGTIGQFPPDLPGPETWPLTGASFILVGPGPARADVLRFFDWALRSGVATAQELDYVTAPAFVMDNLRP